MTCNKQLDMFGVEKQKVFKTSKDGKIKIVVPVSGGKDSQACLQLAVNNIGAESVIALFCDTGFEHPLTYEHIEHIAKIYGVETHTVRAGNVEEKCLKYKRFPSGTARFCTNELKIQPSKRFYKELSEKQGGFEVWYGVRSAESHDRKKRYAGKVSSETYPISQYMSKYPKYLDKLGVVVRLPIIDWSTDDVFDYLAGQENPLYRQGFGRVGCFPCLASGDRWKEKAFEFDETGKKHYEIATAIGDIIGQSIWKSKSGIYKNKITESPDNANGCSFCAM